MIIGRRKFFSFFGTGVAMLAKPDLFIPKREIIPVTEFQWKMWEGEDFPPITLEDLKNGSFQLHAVWALAE